ncbi:UNVERIFIED_CONTAM: putative O-methyltransferase 3 [Sesamum radiatum]|uniref:O-methyltransferase 3 n=1 Tax=Sesamum radiatum TaxID=300843 RepID=A0AAW2S693_SESRA
MIKQEPSSEILEAEAHIWNQVFNYVNSMSVKCVTELSIPEIIHKHGRPMTLTELVDALPGVDRAKADYVRRLMRTVVHSGFFVLEKIDSSDEQGYSLTPASRLLIGDHPMSMKAFVLCELDPIQTEPLRQLEIVGKCFEGLGSLVDVGGGTGTLAKAIAEAFPQIHCTVLDLAPVVAGLEGTRNLKYVEGDMFEYIPPSDAVLLKILKRCKEAITSNERRGKVVIIEMVVDDQKADHKSVETQLFFDMLMMTLVDGRERNQKEWAKLFFDAGFSSYKISPLLGIRSIIEVYP